MDAEQKQNVAANASNASQNAADAPIESSKDTGLIEAAGSAAAAMFGVQSAKNRKRDFESKDPAKFILMGAIMTCLFILCVLFAVRCSLQQAALPNV